MTVAMIADTTPMKSVEYRELMIVRSWKSSTYQRRVKPPHIPRERESLKEYTIKTAIGIYRKTKTR
jgi:hypothetical protein